MPFSQSAALGPSAKMKSTSPRASASKTAAFDGRLFSVAAGKKALRKASCAVPAAAATVAGLFAVELAGIRFGGRCEIDHSPLLAAAQL